jgi:hypothetical protein
MAGKISYLLLAGVFFVAFSGLAAAEAPVLTFPEDSSMQSPADTESGNSLSESYQLRDPVETGSVPVNGSGSSAESLSFDGKGPAVEFGGVTYHYNIDTP